MTPELYFHHFPIYTHKVCMLSSLLPLDPESDFKTFWENKQSGKDTLISHLEKVTVSFKHCVGIQM